MDFPAELDSWSPVARPARQALTGRYARLEPFETAHRDELFAAGAAPGYESRWRYLTTAPLLDRKDFELWFDAASASIDPLYYAVVDRANARALGRLSFMRIDPSHGVIETGHLMFGPELIRTRAATEAIYLQARYVFDELGYRRFEWKCDNANEPSKRAALRFGFTHEGVFRQHLVVKGRNRDTAWFSMLDREWPARRAAFERWLDPENFDGDGAQREPLGNLMPPALVGAA